MSPSLLRRRLENDRSGLSRMLAALLLAAAASGAVSAGAPGEPARPTGRVFHDPGSDATETPYVDRAPVGLRLEAERPAGAHRAPWSPSVFDGRFGSGQAIVHPGPGTEEAPRPDPDSSPLRSAPADSLPGGMPLRVRLLWGERGLVRGLGLAPDTRAGELRLRRSMLQWHQRAGLVTLGALTTQVVLGELIAKDRIKHRDLKPYHKNGAYVTFGLYMTTAGLSLLAPPARRYSTGFSSIKLHRRLAVLHFAGMVAQPLLGRALVRSTSPQQYDDRLQTHLWVGRVTLGAYTAAILSTFLAY